MTVEWPDLTDNPEGQFLAEEAMRSAVLVFDVQRERIQKGKTFSREVMNVVESRMMSWVEARVMARWVQTQEPPTVMRISLRVEVQ